MSSHTPTEDAAAEAVREVPVASIVPNPEQPRRRFSADRIAGLAHSIEAQGVMQPLIVRPDPAVPGQFQLVAGERRWRAVCELGWAQVPVLVRQVPDEALLETALVENLQREQLTVIEEAQSYRALMERHGYTQEALARRVGKERSTIANLVRLLALPPPLQQDLDESRLTMGHARALLAVPTDERKLALRNRVLAQSLSVRETEKLVQQELTRREAARRTAGTTPEEGLPPAYRHVQERLEQRLATRVAIHPGKQDRGRIEIDYHSMDEFNRLFDLLMGR